jgi:hypothetical protein
VHEGIDAQPRRVISWAAATAVRPGDRRNLLRSAASQRDGRPAVPSGDVVVAATGRPLRSVIALIQVLTGPGEMPWRARRLA